MPGSPNRCRGLGSLNSQVVSCILASILTLQPDQAAITAPPRLDSPVRVALTPVLDGRMDLEEWDALAGGAPSEAAFQWEPGSYFWAARAAAGQDAVLSLDSSADGWLVGSDNIEIRVSMRGSEPVMRVRTLNASVAGEPVWQDGGVPPEQIQIAVQPSADGGFVVESSYQPVFGRGPAEGSRTALRIDTPPTGVELGEAYKPRAMATVFLQFDSSRGLPLGVSWRPAVVNRSVARADRIRMTFGVRREEGAFAPVRVETRAEGLAKAVLRSATEPAPGFDTKGRMEVAYDSVIPPGAALGWRVVRATIADAGGQEFVLRSSVRLADLVDIEIGFPRESRSTGEAQIVRGSVTLRSQFSGRLEGVLTMVAPAEWSVTRGKSSPFLIYHTRGSSRVPVEFVIPRGQTGVFPITFRAQIGTEVVERRVFYSVEG